jgi:hypothetical protein
MKVTPLLPTYLWNTHFQIHRLYLLSTYEFWEGHKRSVYSVR